MSTKAETKQTELIKKKVEEVDEETLEELSKFLNRDVKLAIEFIEEGQVPFAHVTLNRRIDLHPAREWVARVPRVLREINALRKVLTADDEFDLDSLYK